jgi:hypothetical protein
VIKQTAKQTPLNKSAGSLACRLRHRTGRRGPSPTAGEVELENIGSENIEIEVTMHPLQYLRLEITDAKGNAIPVPPYGDIFSPRELPYVFRLEPGETYTHNVGLLGYLGEEERKPGTYTVRAVYECEALKAISEPVEVMVPGEK